MRDTSSKIAAAALLITLLLPSPASACSYPEPPSFKEALESASNVFIFRLESAEVKRKAVGETAYTEWIEGRIRVTQDLQGDSSLFESVVFSTSWCGGLRLDVGHYFLVATDSSGPTLKLRPLDPSILDVSLWYSELVSEDWYKSDLLWPIFEYLNGKPLPDGFPPRRAAEYTSSLPPPPPPPQKAQD